MTEFEFENLSFLYLLIVLLIFFFFANKYQKTLVKNFKNFFLNTDNNKNQNFFNKVNFSIKRILFCTIALFFLTLCILQPKWGYKEIRTSKEGRDIAIAVDVSESMLATDIEPNRLTRAKREIIDLIENLRGDRIALVSFSGSAIVEVPLTSDYKAFQSYLEVLDPNFSPIKGSNIKVALQTSIELLTRVSGTKSSKDKAVIIITDGEDSSNAYEEIKVLAEKSNVGIYVIGIGTEKGAELKTKRGLKRDNAGNLVISKLKVKELKELAEKTGGQYVLSVSSDKDIISIYNKGIRQSLKKKKYKNNNQKIWNQYFQIPLLISILMLFLAWKNIDLKGKKLNSKKLSSKKLSILFFIIFFMNSEISLADIKEAKDKFRIGEYNKSKNIFNSLEKKVDTLLGLGASHYRLGEFYEAFENFAEASKIAKNNKVKENALYNTANSLVQLEKYKEAIALYKQALKINSNDTEAKENLKYVEKLIDSSSSSSSQESSEQQRSEQQRSEQSSSEESSQNSSLDNSQSSSEQNSSSQSESSNQQSSQQNSSKENSSGQSSSEQSSEGGSSQESSEQSSSKKDDQGSSSSESSSSSETQQDSAGSKSSEASDSEQIISQIYNVEESFVANNTYRYKKSLEQLKKLKSRAPVNDW